MMLPKVDSERRVSISVICEAKVRSILHGRR